MRDYLATMLEREDAATVWEQYDATITDISRYYANRDITGAKGLLSLCHAWSGWMVPLAQRWMLGIEPIEPGFARVRIDPAPGIDCAFEVTVPTPHGDIEINRTGAGAPVHYRIPKGVVAETPRPDDVVIRRRTD